MVNRVVRTGLSVHYTSPMKFKRLPAVAALLLVVLTYQGLSFDADKAEAKGKKGKALIAKKVLPYPPEFADAIALVVIEKKYKDAFDIFDRLDRNGFCRDKTHYYMALCKHNMNQTQEAALHYQVVYNYSKDPQLRYLASVGYSQVAKYAANRTYSGQGNTFARMSTGGGGGSGGPWGGGGDCGPSG